MRSFYYAVDFRINIKVDNADKDDVFKLRSLLCNIHIYGCQRENTGGLTAAAGRRTLS